MYDTFAKLLKEKKLKPIDVSKATGISPATLSDWKTGKSKPKQDKLIKIADYFGVTVDYLMTGQDNSPTEPQLTKKDERDIAKDMENIIQKLRNNESGPCLLYTSIGKFLYQVPISFRIIQRIPIQRIARALSAP